MTNSNCNIDDRRTPNALHMGFGYCVNILNITFFQSLLCVLKKYNTHNFRVHILKESRKKKEKNDKYDSKYNIKK